MNEVRISLDRVKYQTKPSDGEIGKINNRIAKTDRVRALGDIEDYKEFAKLVGEDGVTFSPTTFHNEKKSKDNFEQMHLIALDLDEVMTLKDAFERCTKYNIRPFMAYESLNSKGQNRFRMLFKNNTSIADKKLAEITLDAINTVLPEADKKCNNISWMYFGGKKLLYFDETLPTIDPESILRNMTYYLKNKKGLHHYKEHVKKFAQKHGIRLTNKGLLDISVEEVSTEELGTFNDGKNLPNSILLFKDSGKNLPKSHYHLNLDDGCIKTSVDTKRPKRSSERSDFLPELSKGCQLFKEFESGKRWLYYPELWGISTNIIHVESGMNYFKQILAIPVCGMIFHVGLGYIHPTANLIGKCFCKRV